MTENGRSALKNLKVNKYTVPVAKGYKQTEFFVLDTKDLADLKFKDPKGYNWLTENWGRNITDMFWSQGRTADKPVPLKIVLERLGNISADLKECVSKGFWWDYSK